MHSSLSPAGKIRFAVLSGGFRYRCPRASPRHERSGSRYRQVHRFVPTGGTGKLQKIRAAVRRAAPEAEEAIRYGIPTFRLDGTSLVHFAAFKDHLSFFPTSSGVDHFRRELTAYPVSRGTIQIPLDTPVPFELVERITRFRAEETRGKIRKSGM